MGKVRVTWQPEALEEVERIHAYHKTFSQQGASLLLKNIFSAANRLAVFPMAGQIEPYLKGTTCPIRSILADKRYKLIYTVENGETLVIIQDVWSCRMDPKKMSSRNRLRSL